MGRTMVVLASSPHHATHWISSLLLRVQLLGFLNIMFALYVFFSVFLYGSEKANGGVVN